MENNIDLPEKYRKLFNDILIMMEKETGDMYQFTINKFGEYNDNKYIIGDFKKRKQKIQVYDMKPEYKELEGVYNNMKEIRENYLFKCYRILR